MINPQWSSSLGTVHSPQTQERKQRWYLTLIFSRKKKSSNTQKRFYSCGIISVYFPLTILPCTVKPTHGKWWFTCRCYSGLPKNMNPDIHSLVFSTVLPHINHRSRTKAGNRSPQQIMIMFMKLAAFYCRTVANNVIPQERSMQLSCFIHQHGVHPRRDSLFRCWKDLRFI